MAPRRNTPRSAAQKGSGTSGSMTTLRETTPYPYIQTPPSDPPSKRDNPKVTIALSLKPVGAGGIVDLLTSEIVSAITALGYTEFYWTLNYVHMWADPSLDAVEIYVMDVQTGIKTSDNGGTTRRARVGLNYPKVLQTPRSESSSSTIVARLFSSTDSVSDCDLRVGVTVWNKA